QADLLGRSLWDIYPDLLGTDVETAFRRARSDRLPVRLEYYYPRVSTWLEISIYPAAEGGLSLYFRGITRKKGAEAVAREREERFRFNLEAANVGTWDWNLATGEVRWSENMESVFGLAPGSFDGTIGGVLENIHPEDRDMVRREIRRAIEGNGKYDIQCR